MAFQSCENDVLALLHNDYTFSAVPASQWRCKKIDHLKSDKKFSILHSIFIFPHHLANDRR